MSYQCPRCNMVTNNPHDERQKYCAHCHRFGDDDGAPDTVSVSVEEPSMPPVLELEWLRGVAANRAHELAIAYQQADKAIAAGRELWDNRAAIIQALGLTEQVTLGRNAINAAREIREHLDRLRIVAHKIAEELHEAVEQEEEDSLDLTGIAIRLTVTAAAPVGTLTKEES